MSSAFFFYIWGLPATEIEKNKCTMGECFFAFQATPLTLQGQRLITCTVESCLAHGLSVWCAQPCSEAARAWRHRSAMSSGHRDWMAEEIEASIHHLILLQWDFMRHANSTGCMKKKPFNNQIARHIVSFRGMRNSDRAPRQKQIAQHASTETCCDFAMVTHLGRKPNRGPLWHNLYNDQYNALFKEVYPNPLFF